MNSEFLKNVKLDFIEKKNERERLARLFDELTTLRTNPYVRRYLQLVQYDSSANREFASKSEEALLNDLFCQYSYRINETNNIYFCLGYFILDDELKEVPILSFDGGDVYKKYIDLEDESKVVRVPFEDVDNFEKRFSFFTSIKLASIFLLLLFISVPKINLYCSLNLLLMGIIFFLSFNL
jgi:hypothetical protein